MAQEHIYRKSLTFNQVSKIYLINLKLKIKKNKHIKVAGLLIGVMNPYFFTALTMKAVGDAAYDMMDFIINDFKNDE